MDPFPTTPPAPSADYLSFLTFENVLDLAPAAMGVELEFKRYTSERVLERRNEATALERTVESMKMSLGAFDFGDLAANNQPALEKVGSRKKSLRRPSMELHQQETTVKQEPIIRAPSPPTKPQALKIESAGYSISK